MMKTSMSLICHAMDPIPCGQNGESATFDPGPDEISLLASARRHATVALKPFIITRSACFCVRLPNRIIVN